MNNYRGGLRGSLRAGITILTVVISLFALIGCQMQLTESYSQPQSETNFSASAQSTVPSNPPAWNANTLYGRAGLYVTHKGKVWVSQWYITRGAEPGKNSWNGWKIAVVHSTDVNNPKPWNINSTYSASGFYVTHNGKVWVSQWHISRGQEPGANSWNGWKKVRDIKTAKPTKETEVTQPAWSQVVGGAEHMLAVNNKGELYAWGRNEYGQLGDGTNTNRSTPTRIGTASDWSSIASSDSSFGRSIAINKKGELFVWGGSSSASSPAKLGSSSNWKLAAGGANHILAINKSGELYAWGSNRFGQLGLTGYHSRSAPTRVGTASNWKQITAGLFYSLAINDSGELYAWGDSSSGQLGLGPSVPYTPNLQKVGTASNWTHVSAGLNHVVALNSSNELYVWGSGSDGKLGNGGTANVDTPTQIGTDTNWTHASAGTNHSLAVKGGELYAWGKNNYGQLGDGSTSTAAQSTPKKIGTASDWSYAFAGVDNSRAFNSKGEFHTWGVNDYGQLGDKSTTNRSSPVKIAHP